MQECHPHALQGLLRLISQVFQRFLIGVCACRPCGLRLGGRKVAKRLKRLVRDGHLNDGYCQDLRENLIAGPGPFTGKRQTTIGGAEAGNNEKAWTSYDIM